MVTKAVAAFLCQVEVRLQRETVAHTDYQPRCNFRGALTVLGAHRVHRTDCVNFARPRHVIGRSVTESIQSGVVLGFASMVEGMCDRFDEATGTESTVVFTGSPAELIAPVVERPVHVEPWLTLQGLRLIYRRN